MVQTDPYFKIGLLTTDKLKFTACVIDNNPVQLAKNFKRSIILGNAQQVEKAGILGPEEQRERHEGGLRRDAAG